MKGFARRIFRWLDLRDGESRPLLLAGGGYLCLIAAHTVMETARDALFLSAMPASRLALVYGALAALALLVSPLSVRFVERFGRRNALVVALMFASLGTTAIYLGPQSASMYFGLYLWTGLLGAVLVSQVWLLNAQIFTASEGKRLFGPIAAGGVLGATLGASASALLLQWIEVHDLLSVAIALLLGAAFIFTLIDVEDPSVTRLPEGVAAGIQSPRALLRSYPYLGRQAAMIVVGTAAVLTCDYLFKSVAAAAFRPDELGTFFAAYYAGMNALALVVQVAVASVLVRRVGVIAALAILPTLMLIGGAGAALAGGGLVGILIAKGADGSLRHSLHRVANELTWMPVPPAVRSRAKNLFDTVLGRAAQALMAGAILTLATFGFDTPVTLAVLLSVLAVLWLMMAWRLRKPYLELFRNSLKGGVLEVEAASLDLNAVEVTLDALSSIDDGRVISAIDLLVSSGRARLIPALILYHESEEVVIRALDAVSHSQRLSWLPLASRLLLHRSADVRVAAIHAVRRAPAARSLPLITARVDDECPTVMAHAVFALATLEGAATAHGHSAVQGILDMEGEAGAEAQLALLNAIQRARDPRWVTAVSRLASSEIQAVADTAALTMAAVPDERFVPALLGRLSHRNGRVAIREAFVSLGDVGLNALVEALSDPDIDERTRLHLPRTISKFKSQRATDVLIDLVASDAKGPLRYKALRGATRMVQEGSFRVDRTKIDSAIARDLAEHLKIMAVAIAIDAEAPLESSTTLRSFQVLRELLEDKLRQSLERVFRLMQMIYRREDLRSVHLALSSTDKHDRATAREFLDALTAGWRGAVASQNRQLLAIVTDELGDSERVRRADGILPMRTLDMEEALVQLLEGSDQVLAAIAGYIVMRSSIKGATDRLQIASRGNSMLASLPPGEIHAHG